VSAQTWPAISSSQAAALAGDWWIFTLAACAVCLLVWGLILFAAIRFRRTERNAEPRSQRDSNAVLEIAWTVAPLLLVIALFFFTKHVEAEVEAVAPNVPVEVAVDGFRWGWTFKYRNGPTLAGTAQNPPEMVLPVGQTVAFHITSSDVVHSFWIPDMLFKRDAIPGLINTFDLTPSKPGTYVGRCGEFCGLDHALMTFRVRVVSAGEYDRWLRNEAMR
jgi:cytochrome c oxidase subunit 2